MQMQIIMVNWALGEDLQPIKFRLPATTSVIRRVSVISRINLEDTVILFKSLILINKHILYLLFP
jgi:hypothetical protein